MRDDHVRHERARRVDDLAAVLVDVDDEVRRRASPPARRGRRPWCRRPSARRGPPSRGCTQKPVRATTRSARPSANSSSVRLGTRQAMRACRARDGVRDARPVGARVGFRACPRVVRPGRSCRAAVAHAVAPRSLAPPRPAPTARRALTSAAAACAARARTRRRTPGAAASRSSAADHRHRPRQHVEPPPRRDRARDQPRRLVGVDQERHPVRILRRHRRRDVAGADGDDGDAAAAQLDAQALEIGDRRRLRRRVRARAGQAAKAGDAGDADQRAAARARTSARRTAGTCGRGRARWCRTPRGTPAGRPRARSACRARRRRWR